MKRNQAKCPAPPVPPSLTHTTEELNTAFHRLIEASRHFDQAARDQIAALQEARERLLSLQGSL